MPRGEQSGSHLVFRTAPRAVAASDSWRPVVGFIAMTWGLGWLVCLPLWLDPMGLKSVHALWVLPVMMFTPCAAAFAVESIENRRSAGVALRHLGVTPIRPTKQVFGFTAVAIVLLPAAVALGIGVAVLLNLVRLDVVTFSGYTALLPEEARNIAPVGILVLVQVVMIPIAAIPNGVLAFGEEVGWRGFLLPALRPLGDWSAVLVTGVVWGVWHSPLILLGYNFDRPDWSGLLLMIVGAVAVGIFLGWLRIWSGSVWPAVFGHGAFNSAGGLVLLLSSAKHPPDLALGGPLGVGTWVVAALFAVTITVYPRARAHRAAAVASGS